MQCPRCDVNMKCDCQACRKNPRKIALPGVYQVTSSNSDSIACGNCGQKAHIDEWEDLEYLEYKRWKHKGVGGGDVR